MTHRTTERLLLAFAVLVLVLLVLGWASYAFAQPVRFGCTVASVHDGDTLRCLDGTRVRLAGIDAPELAGCRGRRGRICVAWDGQASRRALAGMVQGRTLACRRVGTSYRRVVAWCFDGPRDISCAMVASGRAIRWERYWRGHRCGRPAREALAAARASP